MNVTFSTCYCPLMQINVQLKMKVMHYWSHVLWLTPCHIKQYMNAIKFSRSCKNCLFYCCCCWFYSMKTNYRTKCCYGLTMDLLDNIATELSFEFHLYVVRDQLFGSKQNRDVKDFLRSNTNTNTNNGNSNGDNSNTQQPTDHDGNHETANSKYKNKYQTQIIYPSKYFTIIIQRHCYVAFLKIQ